MKQFVENVSHNRPEVHVMLKGESAHKLTIHNSSRTAFKHNSPFRALDIL